MIGCFLCTLFACLRVFFSVRCVLVWDTSGLDSGARRPRPFHQVNTVWLQHFLFVLDEGGNLVTRDLRVGSLRFCFRYP